MAFFYKNFYSARNTISCPKKYIFFINDLICIGLRLYFKSRQKEKYHKAECVKRRVCIYEEQGTYIYINNS